MRQDMSKVIVERPRRGGGYERKGRSRDHDDQPSKEGMRKPYLRGYNNKELNENLAPLLRFLNSRVGQLWDSVYSEICENIQVTNTVQEHIRVHVKQFVETATSVDKDGNIWVHGYVPRPLTEAQHTKLYVDPVTNKLCVNSHYRNLAAMRREREAARQQKLEETERSLPSGIELRKAQGIWYQVEVFPVPPLEKHEYCRLDGTVVKYQTGGSAYDVILEQQVGINHHYGVKWSTTYCRSKRQLSRSELRRYSVTND
jgi:hypothetical protein